jgi:hypothetical protein
MNDAVDQHTQTNVENADPVPATETRVDLLKSATSGSSMDDFAPWLEDGDKATTQAEVDRGGVRDEAKWGSRKNRSVRETIEQIRRRTHGKYARASRP